LAAEQGRSWPQFNLGRMYHHGRGVPQNYTEALRWYRLAAAQGVASAQSALGVMYANGEGTVRDNVQAHKWFNLAAARFSSGESEQRENAVRNRDIVARLMTPAQVIEAQRLAAEWRPR